MAIFHSETQRHMITVHSLLFEIGIELTAILYEVMNFERELCLERFPSVLSK